MEKKYQLDANENQIFQRQLREELLDFGKNFASLGGSSYYLGDDGTPWVERPRETWITSRMAHVYSIGHMLGYPGCDQLAKAAIKGLNGELQDKKSGGFFAGITVKGEILSLKQCYAHAFVILAATSGVLAKIDGANKLLDTALKIYDEKFWDEKEGMAVDTWSTDFKQLSEYRGINANMHTVEAFLAVADTLDEKKYRARAGRIIDRVIGWAKNNHWRIPEHFTDTWMPDLECNKENPADPFKPYGATPGHGIEWSRLIIQWALSSFAEDEEKAKPYIEAAKNLYHRAILDGWNSDGAPGIAYTTDWQGNPVVHDRMHWTLAEAINTSSVLYRVTGEATYADDYAMFMTYLDEYVHDKVNGSWYHQLDQDNQLLDTVWPGKSDLYHAFQSTLIPYQKVSVSIAKAVK